MGEVEQLLLDSNDVLSSVTKLAHVGESWQERLQDVWRQKATIVSDMEKYSKELKRLREVARGLERGNEEQVKLVRTRLKECDAFLYGMRAIPPQTTTLLSAGIGPINVKMSNRKERLAFKMHYEEFKRVATYYMIGYVLVLLYLEPAMWMDQALHSFTLYYYITLSLRENILKLNGSSIRQWWLSHHYLSVLLSAVLLTLPPGEAWTTFRPLYLLFVTFIGFVQLLQFRYQTARLRVARAMGSESEMEVTNNDNFQVNWTHNMYFLTPFLLLGQFFQLFNAAFLLQLSAYYDVEWQIVAAGCLFAMLGVGNTVTTTSVLKHKWASQKDE